MEYRAITKADPDTELTHFKYVKREKKGDGWKYYYDTTSKAGSAIGKTVKDVKNVVSTVGSAAGRSTKNVAKVHGAAASAVVKPFQKIYDTGTGVGKGITNVKRQTEEKVKNVGAEVKNTKQQLYNAVKNAGSKLKETENTMKESVKNASTKVEESKNNAKKEVKKLVEKYTTIDEAVKFKKETEAKIEKILTQAKLSGVRQDYELPKKNIFKKAADAVKDAIGFDDYEHMQTMRKNADRANREVSNANSAKAYAETKYRQALNNQANNLGEKDSSINNTQTQQSDARKVESAAKVYSQSIERGRKALVSANMRNAMAEKAAADYDKTLHAKVSKAKKAVNDFFDEVEGKIEDSKEKSREKKELKSAYKEAEDKLKQLEKDVKDAERAFNISVGNPDYSEKDVRDFDKWLSNAKTLRDQAQTEYEAAKKAYKDYDK